MSKPKRPNIGECVQFMRTTLDDEPRNILTAALVTGYDDKHGLVITYVKRETGEKIEGAMISVYDLVSDEDASTRDFE